MQRIGDTSAFRERTLIVKGADVATRSGWTGVPNFILENKKLWLNYRKCDNGQAVR